MSSSPADQFRASSPAAARGISFVITLVLLAASFALVTARPAQAVVASGWTVPATVTSSGFATHVVSATAPTGADLSVWTFAPSGDLTWVSGAVRQAGHANWQKIPSVLDARTHLSGLALAATPTGDFVLTWSEGTPVSRTYLMRLPRGSTVWRAPQLVFTDTTYSYTEPHVTVADTGTVLVSATATLAGDATVPPTTRIAAAVQATSGTWTRSFLTATGTYAGRSAPVATTDGRFAVAFVAGYLGSQATLSVATRGSARTAAWSAPVAVSVVGGVDGFDASAGAGGRVAVSWTGPADGTADDLSVAWATVPSSGVASWTTRALASGPDPLNSPHVVVAPNGRVTTTWIDYAVSESVVRGRAASALTGGLEATRQVSSSGRFAGSPQVSLRPDGGADVLWIDGATDGGDDGLRVGTVSASGASSSTVVDGSYGPASADLSLRTTPDGARHVVWFDATGNGAARWMRTAMTAPVAVRSLTDSTLVRIASVAGTKRVGHKQTCGSVFWVDATSSSYRWYRNGSLIGGHSGTTYTTTGSDYRTHLTCAVTATNQAGGTSTRLIKSKASTIAVGVRLHATKKPKVTGTRKVGKRLHAQHGSWSPGASSYAYRWLRGGKAIAKHATSSSYVLTKRDKGHHISVRVTARRTGYVSGTATAHRTAKIRHR